MTAYYNEIDPYAAQWLRNLIEAGHVAPGLVDERSIEDVRPDEIRDYTQCHFFAGIGVWSYALRLAGWPDDEPIWTGSCPCQPFSAAGKGAGFSDERHLWPAWDWLISECRPAVIVGEQVASKDIDPWIDLVQADLEAMGYAIGCVPFPSAGVGAPHIRDRLYWVAHSYDARLEGRPGVPKRSDQFSIGAGGVVSGVADSKNIGHERSGELREPSGRDGVAYGGAIVRPGPTNRYWQNSDWIGCRDDKFRPVEPGAFPLVTSAPARVGRLRAYGNAINAQAAKVFIESVMDCLP